MKTTAESNVMPDPPTPIDVAIGIVLRPFPTADSGPATTPQLLVSLRQREAVLGSLWEFPGGKIEPGEDPADCVRRELREELDIVVEPTWPWLCLVHDYDHGRVRLTAVVCRHAGGTPRAVEVAAVRWVSLDALDELAMPAANAPLVAALCERFGGR